MKLEKDTWYWISHPHEGDIFYPVFVVDDKYIMMDGKMHLRDALNTGLVVDRAVMPSEAERSKA